MLHDYAAREHARQRMLGYARWVTGGPVPPGVMQTILALEALPKGLRDVLVTYFTQPGGVGVKARSLGIRRAEFYLRLAIGLETLQRLSEVLGKRR